MSEANNEQVLGEAPVTTDDANTQGAETQGLTGEEGTGFSFNMSETSEDAGFEPIPKGNYAAVIEACEFKISQSSSQPMWAITWAITEGEYAEKGRKLFNFVSFKKEQLPRAKTFLKRVAPDLAESTNFNPEKVANEGLMLGRAARLKVGMSKPTEEYPDPRNEIKDVFAPTSGGGGAAGGSFNL